MASAFCSRAPAPAAESPHNVVIICIDTLRADHVSAYGYSRTTTPFIDELAKRGARFETAYAHSNWTVPSTASLLTSLHPSEHGAGIAGNMRLLGENTPILQIRSGVETLATRLKRSGFRTGLFSANPFLFGRFEDGFKRAEVERKSASQLTAAARRWLDEQPPDDRFFLYIQYMDLHHPIEPPGPFFNYFEVPEGGTRTSEHGDWSYGEIRDQRDLEDPGFRQYRAHHVALYDGALRYVDATIRRLYLHLERTGRAENTLFVITSDHGEEFWDHALAERAGGKDPRGYWGVGHGHTMYEELLRVPLIVAGPSVGDGLTVPCVARHIDVAPTVLELLGVGRWPAMRGRSLRRSLRNAAVSEKCDAAPLIAESPAYGPDSRAVMWNRRKLVVRSDGSEFLFDLRDDPGEHENLAGRRPELAAALRAIGQAEVANTTASQPGEAMQIDEETKRQLRALGYLK